MKSWSRNLCCLALPRSTTLPSELAWGSVWQWPELSIMEHQKGTVCVSTYCVRQTAAWCMQLICNFTFCVALTTQFCFTDNMCIKQTRWELYFRDSSYYCAIPSNNNFDDMFEKFFNSRNAKYQNFRTLQKLLYLTACDIFWHFVWTM
jgi:homospermidine synthase